MSENNDTSNESNSLGSDSIIRAARLTGGGSSSVCGGFGGSFLRAGVLRPSLLGSNLNANNNSAATEEAQITKEQKNFKANPFMQTNDDEEDKHADNEETPVKTTESEEVKSAQVEQEKPLDDDDIDQRPDPLTLLRKNGLERANLFAAAKNSIPLVEKSGFVFGQNVHERVIGENINAENIDSTPSELLFSNVIQNAAQSTEKNEATNVCAAATVDGANSTSKDNENTKTLTDVAREYEEYNRAQKRKYEEVETFTGEEGESNIIDINCKLFAFVNSNWEERGRGSLRLNDSQNELECSRVVFRTSGNLRLVLNTKVWGGMVAERSSQKSLRLTAMDNTGIIKIFLIMARPLEINQLHKALTERINKRKATHPQELCSADVEKNGSGSKNGEIEEAKSSSMDHLIDEPVTSTTTIITEDDDDDEDDVEEEKESAEVINDTNNVSPSKKLQLGTADD